MLNGLWLSFFLVAAQGGAVTGYILGCARRNGGELVSIAVDPAARRP